ncbi:hypothetical protein LPJ56_005923, partial [Coemansia sp. RSA 2599]
MFARFVKNVDIKVVQTKLKTDKVMRVCGVLDSPEYKHLSFASARSLNVCVDIDYPGYPSAESEDEEEEWYNE